MKALSLTQPWAWLVVHGGKDVENRVWHLPRGMVGVPFLVHAAKGMRRADYESGVDCAAAIAPGVKVPAFGDLARGAVIGKATAIGCLCPVTDGLYETVLEHNAAHPWHFQDQHGFRLVDVAPSPVIVPCKGALGFWTVPDDVIAKLRGAP